MSYPFLDRMIHAFGKFYNMKGWHKAVTGMAAVVVFVTTYMLILPVLTMEKINPSLTAEQVQGALGDALTLSVSAEADNTQEERVFLISALGDNAGLDDGYVFDEYGVTNLLDDNGKAIELHRDLQENGSLNYWFTLSAGESTQFSLLLGNGTQQLVEQRALETEEDPAEPEEESEEPSEEKTPADDDEAAENDEVTAASDVERANQAAEPCPMQFTYEDGDKSIAGSLKFYAGSAATLEEARESLTRKLSQQPDADLEFVWAEQVTAEEAEEEEVTAEEPVEEKTAEKSEQTEEPEVAQTTEEPQEKSVSTQKTTEKKTKIAGKVTEKAQKKAANNTTNLNDLAKSVTIVIDGKEYGPNDPWKIRAGEPYTLKLHFNEDDAWQFMDDETEMVYRLPDGMTLGDSSFTQTFDLSAGIDGTFSGNTYTYDPTSKTIKVKLNAQAENFGGFAGTDRAYMDIDLTAYFDSEPETFIFGKELTATVDYDTSHEATVSKKGVYNKDTNKIDYTLTVTNYGESTNVVVTDEIKGTALTFDKNVSISGNNDSNGDIQENIHDNSFEITIPKMANKDVITISYSASVDYSKLSGNGTAEQTKNNVKIKTNDQPEKETSHNLENWISYESISKSAGAVSGSGNKKTVSWSITANPERKVSMAGKTITDTIVGETSQKIMKYSGPGITIVVTDSNGNEVRQPETILWSNLTKHDQLSWTYTVPEGDADKAYQYTITYTTEVDVSKQITDTKVSNKVETNDGHSDDSSTTVPPGDGKVTLKKAATDVNAQTVTWDVTFTVPKEGLSSAVVTDTYPAKWGDYYDVLQDGSIEITGTTDPESYKIDTSDKNKAVITFYKDKEQKTEGLLPSTAEREIKITLTTKNSEKWMDDMPAGTSNGEHTNNVSLSANGQVVTASDTAYPLKQGIFKSGKEVGKVTIDGVELPVYKYQLDLYGVDKDTFDIVDTFNTKYLRFYDISEMTNESKPAGADTWWDQHFHNGFQNIGNNRKDKVPATETGNGVTFKVTQTVLPKDNGQYLSRYTLVYYLIVKDKEALQKLYQEAVTSEDAKVTLKNDVKWDNYTGHTEIDSDFSPVEKSASDVKDGKVKYKIVLNPGRVKLHGGHPITMTDTYTNLSVDYQTIKVVTEPADRKNQVKWNYSGYTGTYTIPDETKVTITYDAVLIGKAGESVTYSNRAEMEGYFDQTSDTQKISGGAGGVGETQRIRLFKYPAGDMSQGLAGAVFQLYEATDDGGMTPMQYEKAGTNDSGTHNVGDPIFFTTGSDGYVTVLLNMSQDGVSLHQDEKYYLIETKAPTGYENDFVQWSFEISPDTVEYDTEKHTYRYYNNDILKIANNTKQGGLVIAKSIVGGEMLTQAQKEAITFTVTGKFKVDETGTTIEEKTLTIPYSEFTGGQYRIGPEKLVAGETYTVIESNADFPSYTRKTTCRVDNDPAEDGMTKEVTFSQDDLTNLTMHKVSYTNSYSTHSYDFTKTDSSGDGNALPGAVFTAYDENDTVIREYTTNSDGKFSIFYNDGYAENTQYYVVETRAPEGYLLPKHPEKHYFYFSSLRIMRGVNLEAEGKEEVIQNKKDEIITVKKVDKTDPNITLSGVSFRLEEYKNGQWQTVKEDMVTDEDGLLTFGRESGYDAQLSKGVYYRLIETSVGATNVAHGYQLDSTPHYFVWATINKWGSAIGDLNYYYHNAPNKPNEVDHQKGNLIYIDAGGGSFEVTNESNKLRIKKEWVKDDGSERSPDSSSVDVTIYRIAKELRSHTVSVNVVINGETKYAEQKQVKPGSDVTVKFGLAYNSSDVSYGISPSEVPWSISNNNSITIPNITEDKTIEIKIDGTIYWDGNYEISSVDPEFEYPATGTAYKTVTLNEGNHWTDYLDLPATDPETNQPYRYYFAETSGTSASTKEVKYFVNGEESGNGITSGIFDLTKDNVASISVQNVGDEIAEDYTLPSTGGSGTLPYTLGGILMMAGSLLYYRFSSKRQRERRLWQ